MTRSMFMMVVLTICAYPAQGNSFDGIDIRSLLLKRDPFQSLRTDPTAAQAPARPAAQGQGQSRPEPESRNLQLRAVIHDRAKSLANIGGMIVEVGDSVDGYRVMAISERYVDLSGKGQQMRLSVDGAALR